MYRNLLLGLCAAVLVAGCETAQPVDPFSQPGVAPQMKQLEKFLGQWEGTAELISPTKEEMAKHAPEIAEELGDEMHGTMSFEMALDGRYLKGEGWYEMGSGAERVHYKEMWTWDAKHNKYRTFMFSNWGEHGMGWAWSNDGGATYMTKATMTDAHGNSRTGKGWMKLVDGDTIEWEWTEQMGLFNKMVFGGTSERVE